jgi:hypothetical protein
LPGRVKDIRAKLAGRREPPRALAVSKAAAMGRTTPGRDGARLWSQDMQDGLRIGKTLKVANPFK